MDYKAMAAALKKFKNRPLGFGEEQIINIAFMAGWEAASVGARSSPEGRFTCPQCGGHNYGTHNPGDPGDQWTRHCNGYISGERIVRCGFEWPTGDDAKYGLV
jgi:hypothetical protein